MSARSWCFTINNYTINDIINLENIKCRYLIYGFEIGANGTPHLQSYIEFAKVIRFNAIKKLIPRAHIEQRRGTREQARNYCMKGEQPKEEWEESQENGPNFGLNSEFIELGDWEAGGQGRRTDLDLIRERAIDEGMRAVTAIGNLQQIKVAEKFLQYNEEERDWKPLVIWLHGATGTGKSRLAREICDGTYYAKKDGTKWWDGYDNHEEVIIDDFRDSWWSFTTMLSLLDRYGHTVECKGGSRQFRARKIIITSAFKPSDCYKGIGEELNQLLRRIDIVESLSSDIEQSPLDVLNDDYSSMNIKPDPPGIGSEIDLCSNIINQICNDDQSQRTKEPLVIKPAPIVCNNVTVPVTKSRGNTRPSTPITDNEETKNKIINSKILITDKIITQQI